MALLERQVDRRQFIKGAAFGAVGLAGAALLGCEGSNPEDLIQALLTTPLKEEELPSGLVSRGISAGQLDATSIVLEAIGTVNIAIAEINNPLSVGGIGYTVFKDKKGPPRGLEVVKSQASISPTQNISKDGLPSSAFIARLDTFLSSLHLVITPVDNVLVMSAYNNALMAVQLEKSAIAHLKRVR